MRQETQGRVTSQYGKISASAIPAAHDAMPPNPSLLRGSKAGDAMSYSDVMILAIAGATGGAIYWAVRYESNVFQIAWKAIRKR